MTAPVPLVEIWRGAYREAVHLGHAAIADASGQIVAAWGDPEHLFLPRSSLKPLQALPLVETGAFDAQGLSDRHLALACASHSAAAAHTETVAAWLADLGLGPAALVCGAQEPEDHAARDALIRAGQAPGRIHNNCSGKHAGFLTAAQHLGAGLAYADPAHPVQQAVRDAVTELTGTAPPGHGIDGCSAPNYAVTLAGLARAMARFAAATGSGDARDRAAHRIVRAMMAHPDMIHGAGSADTELMRRLDGQGALKRGAEGVQIAILPGRGLGIAIKCADGASRGREGALAALLVALGALTPEAARPWTHTPILSAAGEPAGQRSPAPGFPGPL